MSDAKIITCDEPVGHRDVTSGGDRGAKPPYDPVPANIHHVPAAEVPEEIRRACEEMPPTVYPTPPTKENPRAHMPQWGDRLPGVLPKEHPRVQKYREDYRRLVEKERAREARKMALLGPEAPVRFGKGECVRITGPAKAYEPEADGTLTDHRGSAGIVEDSYHSHERKERIALVRTGEDNKLRGIPESRLKEPEAKVTATMSGTYGPGDYERIFGHEDPGEARLRGAEDYWARRRAEEARPRSA